MDNKQLEAMSHVDKVVIFKLVGTSKWLFQYMKNYNITEDDFSKRTGFSAKKVHGLLEVNVNMTVKDVAIIEVALGDIVREKIRLFEIEENKRV